MGYFRPLIQYRGPTKHNKCPKVENIWHVYQRDISAGQRTYKSAK